jgi:hypothetical protein
VEDLGAYYLVVLNDPQLRRGIIADAERSQRSATNARTGARLRALVAEALQALASRIQPREARATETSSPQPVFVE